MIRAREMSASLSMVIVLTGRPANEKDAPPPAARADPVDIDESSPEPSLEVAVRVGFVTVI